MKTIGLHIHPNHPLLPAVCQDRLRDRRQAAAGGAESQHGCAVCVPRLCYIRSGFGTLRQKLHAILDKLNPDLRSTEEVDGKKRVREFYAMPPEDSYAILEAIAEINGFRHRLKKWKATAEEQRGEQAAQEISEAHHERLSAFAFSKCNIPVGAEIEFSCRGNQNSGTVCTVADDKHVKYNGEIWSLSGLAKYLVGTTGSLAGPKYFKYHGEWLSDIRRRLEGRD